MSELTEEEICEKYNLYKKPRPNGRYYPHISLVYEKNVTFKDYLQKLYEFNPTILDLSQLSCGYVACSDCMILFHFPIVSHIKEIINWCKEHPIINTLHLSNNKISDEEIKLLVSIDSLQTLVLHSCGIDDNGAQILGTFSNIKHLILTNNKITLEGAIKLVTNKSFEILMLGNNNIKPWENKRIIIESKYNPNLKFLDLEINAICNFGN